MDEDVVSAGYMSSEVTAKAVPRFLVIILFFLTAQPVITTPIIGCSQERCTLDAFGMLVGS